MSDTHITDTDFTPTDFEVEPQREILTPSKKTWTKRLLLSGVLGAYLAGVCTVGLFTFAAKGMPSVETFWEPNRPVSVQIVDRNGQDILVRGAQDAGGVKLDTLSPHLKNAVLAVEDRRFAFHIGLDPIGLTRAMYENVKAGRVVQGGSTLTQQLAKNVFLTPEQTLTRKAQEGLLAIWLEFNFSKDEIFTKYLNRVYFGGGNWGIEAASQRFLRKPTSGLTLEEAALLAGLLKAPSQYNPINYPDRAARRTATVLLAMEDADVIDRRSRYEALQSPVTVHLPETANSANYFVDWIWEELEAAIGPPNRDIVVQTTLDMEAQTFADKAIASHLAPELGAKEAALVTIDGEGAIRAMVGGLSYANSQFNRASQAERQPGSAFKPFVYLAAFEAGFTPWDWRSDQPVIIDDWEPQNFDEKFRGPLMLEDAFAKSINTIAVTLSEEIGRERVIETAERFGFKDLKPYRSLPLGSQTVTPVNLVSAYLPFANWGARAEPYGILSIATANGTPLYYHEKKDKQRTVSSEALGHMNRLMTQTVKLGSGRQAQLPGHDVGGKTGTTNDYRDAWFVGFVPDIVTGVWVGSDENLPMQKVTGGSIPAKIWKDMMGSYLGEESRGRLPVSEPPIRPTMDKSKTLEMLLEDIETALP